jgi:two-component system, OmpR family, sensor histidine kinase TctE
MRGGVRSLQLRLALRLGLVYLLATGLAIAVLVYRAFDTAGSLNDRELTLRAEDLAASVSLDNAGTPWLDLPRSLARDYAAEGNANVYVIRRSNGPVIAASPPRFGDRVKAWPAPGDDPSYFRLSDIPEIDQSYYGLSVALDSAAGPLWITVAHAGEANALIRSLLWEFEADLAWGLPVFVVVTLVIGVLAIRSSLKPLREVSQQAAAIGPATTSARLRGENLPREIVPLVDAVNRAFDRLEQGFAMQRQFTANAAHELRTPLSIVTGALDAMEENADVAKLKADVARMNRLVDQLLRAARLDAISLDVTAVVDLTAVTVDIVAMMAPWVISQGRSVGFSGCEGAVLIRGNSPAIGDAIRNLIENAVTHAPVGDEIKVMVDEAGRVTVADHGPGVPRDDREHVFDRFWRDKSRTGAGAGLGLAITREIMRVHGGTAEVEDNSGGGAVFTLSFSRCRSGADSPQALRASLINA